MNVCVRCRRDVCEKELLFGGKTKKHSDTDRITTDSKCSQWTTSYINAFKMHQYENNSR